MSGLLVMATLAGCELEQVTVIEVEDVVIAEVYVSLAADPVDHELRAFLHRTLGSPGGNVEALANASITVTRSDGVSFTLVNTPIDECVESAPEGDPGACFLANPVETTMLGPGDLLEVQIDLVEGGKIVGATRVPGAFELDRLPFMCRLEPNTLLPVKWSRAVGAWAYVNETSIRGLRDALAPEDISVEDDPLYLLGISVSDTDTTIVFPSEFGVFNRFELDPALAVRLQEGLPAGARAEITITAVDQNYVNWARGGNFNPSGQVRVPSLHGDGTGVFGSTVVRRFNAISTNTVASGLQDCRPPGT